MLAEKPDLQAIFNEAIAHEGSEERTRFLDEACGNDPKVRERIEALLRAHSEAGGFFGGRSTDTEATEVRAIAEQVGTSIGPYKLLQQIGEGGFGIVFMAEQVEPVRRRVALKVIKPGMDTRQVIARFEAERQALAVMDHPNIARVLDAGATESGRPYFVMELVRGTPITQYCDENNLPVRERLELFATVCQAIQHAHTKGIIHRDIKPTNVLVTRQDGQPVVKVIDFGIAKAMGQQLTEKTLFTDFAQMIGTPLYMSPEQAELSSNDIDTRSDVYSLGVLLYELLTGSTPVSKEQLKAAAFDEIRRIIREDEPPKPSTRISTAEAAPSIAAQRHTEPGKLARLVRGELDWIVMKALEKDRNRRYETANGFAADVQRYLADEAVQACPPSAAYRFRKLVRRYKVAFAMASLFAALLLLTVVVLAVSNVWVTWERNQKAQALTDKQAALVKETAALVKATEEGRRADHEAAQAKKDRRLERMRFGAAQINLAHQAWSVGDPARTLELLETLRPKVGEEDLRTFEWYYLWGQCHRQCRLILSGHTSRVASIAYSPDGKLLASGSHDGTVRLWDPATGQQVHAFRIDSACISVAFSPDSRLLAASDGKLARLWNVADRKERLTLAAPGLIRSLAFAPDGEVLATGDQGANSLTLWDVRTGKRLASLPHDDGIPSVAFSPDGKLLAGGSWHGIKLWNWDGAGTAQERPNVNLATPVAFSPDSKKLVSHCGFLLDVESGQVRRVLQGPRVDTRCNVYSPDGKSVASGRGDRCALLWEPATGKELARYAHLGAVSGVAFSPDGGTLATGSEDRTIKLWDLTARIDVERRGTSTPELDQLASLAFLPGSDTLVVGGLHPAGVVLWDSRDGTEKVLQPGRGLAAVSPNGKVLASSSFDATSVTLWDLTKGQQRYTLAGHTGHVWDLAFSPDGKSLATGGYDRNLFLWDVVSGERVATPKPRWPVASLAYSPDGKLLVATGMMGAASILDAATGGLCLELAGPELSHWMYASAFSPDGRTLATGSQSGILNLYDTSTWEVRSTLRGHTDAIWALAFFRDSQTLISGSNDGSVRFWDVETGQERMTLRDHGFPVAALAVSSDGGAVAAASTGGAVKVWRAATLKEAQARKEVPPDALALNKDAWRLATAPRRSFRNPPRAVELAQRAVELEPNNGGYANTLGAAYYRAGDCKAAITALEKSMELRKGGDSFDWYFLAMAHWQLGEKDKAREWHDRAAEWMDKNQPTNEELLRFRAEAAELLAVENKKD